MGLCSICKGLSDDGMDEKMKKKLNLELGSFSKKMEKEDRVDSIINKIQHRRRELSPYFEEDNQTGKRTLQREQKLMGQLDILIEKLYQLRPPCQIKLKKFKRSIEGVPIPDRIDWKQTMFHEPYVQVETRVGIPLSKFKKLKKPDQVIDSLRQENRRIKDWLSSLNPHQSKVLSFLEQEKARNEEADEISQLNMSRVAQGPALQFSVISDIPWL